MNKIISKEIGEIILIIIGSFIFAFGINYFTIPNRLSEGGIIGVTIVTYYLFEWSPGIVNFLLNAVLLAVGYKFFSKQVTLYIQKGLSRCLMGSVLDGVSPPPR